MKYEEHNFQQGSVEWHAHRSNCYNASELAAADGASPFRTRNKLIALLATGSDDEIHPEVQKRFDDGHRFEALARPQAEEIIGEDLFPSVLSAEVAGLSRRLGVSCDGKTMDDSINWEHKGLNADLAVSLDQGIIPPFYHYQMEQGMLITGAERTLFTASKWDADDNLIDIKHAWYESNPELRARIVPIWQQLEKDLANYKPVEVIPAAVAAPIKDLPTLFIQAKGEVTNTNMPEFKQQIEEFLGTINKKPATDQEFADGKATAAKLRELATKIKERKADMLAQTASIGEVAKEIDLLADIINANALELEKAVKKEEEARKLEIITSGRTGLAEHVAALSARLGGKYMPIIAADFAEAIKGKRLISSMQDAVDTLLAQKKIEADAIAAKIEANLSAIATIAADHDFLFADKAQLVLKDTDAVEAIIRLRLAEHKAAEDRRIEAERVKKEEAAKAEAEKKAAEEAKAAEAPARTVFAIGEVVPAGAVVTGVVPSVECLSPAVNISRNVNPIQSVADVARATMPADLANALYPDEASTLSKIGEALNQMKDKELDMVLHYCERLIAQRKPAEAA